MNEYLNSQVDRQVLIGRCVLLSEALKFVLNGVHLVGRRNLPEFALKARHSLAAVSGHAIMNSVDWPAKFMKDETDPYMQFIDEWLDELLIHGSKSTALPYFDMPKAALDRLKGAGCTKQPYKTETNTVEGAFRQAKRNAAVIQSRLVTLYTVMVLASVDNVEAWHQLSDHLHEQLSHFNREIMMFAILLGGDAIEEAKHLAAGWYLNRSHNMSIMEYLEPDGVAPASWMSSTEEKFRKDILSRFERK
jgi:hypothetical protein